MRTLKCQKKITSNLEFCNQKKKKLSSNTELARNTGNFLNLMQVIYAKPAANMILNGEILNAFNLR